MFDSFQYRDNFLSITANFANIGNFIIYKLYFYIFYFNFLNVEQKF